MSTARRPLALVTGGSSGLGYAIADRLAADGYDLLVLSRSADRIMRAADTLRRRGTQVEAFVADITDAAALAAIADHLRGAHRRIRMLVLNAGTGHTNTLVDTDAASVKEDIDVNLWGTALTAKTFLPLLDVPGDGAATRPRLLFISSAFGLTAGAGYAAYCGSKAGVVNFALAIRRELLGKASVHVACPADIDTPMYHEELRSRPDWMKSANVRTNVIPADVAAARILKKCTGDRFLIFTSWDMFFLLVVLPRLLPSRWMLRLGDRLLPVPPP